MGQEHVTRTLQNAIRAGRIGHAYLFCGSRGTGKTTVARLLAKALNCEKGPIPEPCNSCEACVAIVQGAAVDVVEMDAASHRSVDDIDALRDSVKYPPMQLRYKVYIIDEAHQLSSHAKDAFLKTLEEPPAHAVFVLATTEAHEIPLTIRSRCQQFDFRRGSLSDISDRLKFVAESEGVQIEPEAMEILARGAAGSWRDGLSLLEQVVAFTEQNITAQDVNAVLGAVAQETLFEVADVIARKDAAAAFVLADKLISQGKDVKELLRAISGHFRNLLFAQSAGGSGGEDSPRMNDQSAAFTRGKLISLVEIFSEAERETRWTDQHRLLLEMAFLKGIEEPEPKPVTQVQVVERPAQQRAAKSEPVSSAPFQRRTAPAASNPARTPVKQAEEPEETTELPVTGDGVVTIEEVLRVWPSVLKIFKGSKDASIHAILSLARPLRVEDGQTVVIGFSHERSFDRSRVEEPSYQRAMIRTLSHLLGNRITIKTEVLPHEEYEEVAPPADAQTPGTGSLLDVVLSSFPGSVVEDAMPQEGEAETENTPWEEDENAKDA